MTFQIVSAAALLAIAFYAQHRIAFYTAGRSKILVTRLALAVVGILLGGLAASLAPDRPAAVFLFLQGFGLVHFAAAVILLLKRARHEGRS